MSALLLGFIIGAVFYVLGGRDTALGDLELPQRLGLVAVVGVVLLLVAMLFSGEAPEGPQQPVQQDMGRSASQSAPASPASGQAPAAETMAPGQAASPAATTAEPPSAPPASEPESEPETAAATETEAVSETAEPASAVATEETAEASEAALQCVFSPDSGRCTCLDGRGYLVEVELERCRELATPDVD